MCGDFHSSLNEVSTVLFGDLVQGIENIRNESDGKLESHGRTFAKTREKLEQSFGERSDSLYLSETFLDDGGNFCYSIIRH